jgi:hypothetical protein
MGLFAWLVVGLAASLYSGAWKLFHRSERRAWRRDAWAAVILSLAAGAGLARLDAVVAKVFHAYAPITVELFPKEFDASWPALGFFLPALIWALVYAALVGLLIFVARVGWNRRAWWFWAEAALILVSLGPARAHSLAAYGIGWAESFLLLLVAVGVVALFLHDNILSYVAVLFCVQLGNPLLELFSQPNAFLRWNGVALTFLAALVLIWMLVATGGMEVTAGDSGSRGCGKRA